MNRYAEKIERFESTITINEFNYRMKGLLSSVYALLSAPCDRPCQGEGRQSYPARDYTKDNPYSAGGIQAILS